MADVESFEMNQELLEQAPKMMPRKKGRRLISLLKLGLLFAFLVAAVVIAFTGGWFASWVTNDAIRNKMQDGSWAYSPLDDTKAKTFTPVMEVADGEIQVIRLRDRETKSRTFESLEEEENEGEEAGDRTILKDPVTKQPVFYVDREFVRDLPFGSLVDADGNLTDESLRITITEVATKNYAEIIPLSLTMKSEVNDLYPPLDDGSNPTYFFQWNGEARAILKMSASEEEMELVWPLNSAEIEKANDFFRRLMVLYEPFMKAQAAVPLEDEDLYVPPDSTDARAFSRTVAQDPVRRFEVDVDGVKRAGWVLRGSCWVSNCRPIQVKTLIIVQVRSCGFWLLVSRWIITTIPARCHGCSRCNLKCHGLAPNHPNVCSNRGTCQQGKCKCQKGFAGSNCQECDCRYDRSSYPNCNRCETRFGGNSCQDCADGYWPKPLCAIKRKCGSHYFDRRGQVCSGHGECNRGFSIFGTCTCQRGYRLPYCDQCLSNFTGENCSECKPGFKGTNCDEIVKCGTFKHFEAGACSGHGTCGSTTGTCSCAEGWEGTYCENETRKCHGHYASTACSGKGTCQADGTCLCNTYYHDTECQKEKLCHEVSPNDENVCSKHGNCLIDPEKDEGTCACSSGWKGAADCSAFSCEGTFSTFGSVCSGHGTCSGPNQCLCQEGYSGCYCQKALTCNGQLFETNPCGAHGTCQGTGAQNCQCDAGWTGPDCTTPVCNCNNRGTCTDPELPCQCQPGFFGRNCETPLTCNGKEGNEGCPSGGECQAIDNEGNGQCVCKAPLKEDCSACVNQHKTLASGCTACLPHLTGANCDSCKAGYSNHPACDECEDEFFKNSNGDCVPCGCDSVGSSSTICNKTNGACTCEPGHDGGKCDGCEPDHFLNQETRVCQSCQCNKEGILGEDQCDPTTGECTCKEGWFGNKCQHRVQCDGIASGASDVCNGRGTCVLRSDIPQNTSNDIDASKSGTCKCSAHFKGEWCGEANCAHLNECNDRGSCEIVGNDAACVCPTTGLFWGPKCDLPITCESNCSGNGECVPLQDTQSTGVGKCVCKPEFTGGTCNQCAKQNRKLPDCTTCDDGHEGENCETCVANYFMSNGSCEPCTCTNGSTCKADGQCECNAGFYGASCEHACACSTNGISSDTCDDTGRCTQCLDGFGGLKCEIPRMCNGIVHTASDVCNGHPCIDRKNQRFPITDTYEGKCDCPSDYSGNSCETPNFFVCDRIRSTESGVCNGNGSCTGEEHCECNLGFEGDYCDEESSVCYDQTGPNACSGNGICQKDGTCTCCGTTSGDRCQVGLSWEKTNTIQAIYDGNAIVPSHIYGPALLNGVYTVYVRHVQGTFSATPNGDLRVGVFVSNANGSTNLGGDARGIGLRTSDGRVQSGSNNIPYTSAIDTLKTTIRVTIDSINTTISYATRVDGETEFTDLGIARLGAAILTTPKFAISGRCMSLERCIVEFVENPECSK